MKFTSPQEEHLIMNRKSKIESKKQNKLERIINSASRLFSENNFHEVMMEDVAKEASVAKGTLYNYFKSKEDLYFSIMLSRMENLIRQLKENISYKNNPLESLHSYVIHNYIFMVKYDSFFTMLHKDSLKAANKVCEELKRKKKELREILNDILKDGINENLFCIPNAQLAADTIIGSIYGAVEGGIKNNLTKNKLNKEREDLFDIILKGLLFENSGQIFPLRGKTIVLTRTIEESKESIIQLRKLGANVINFPTLEICPTDNWSVFDSVINDFSKVDFLIFTSARTVKYFIERCKYISANLNLENLKVIAVGKKTAEECKKNKINVDIIPEEFSAEGIIKSLSNLNIKEKNIFIPGSEIMRRDLSEKLKDLGAIVTTTSIYKVNIPSGRLIEENIEMLKTMKPDIYVFTSPSTFTNFLEILKISEPSKYFNGNIIAAIGNTTKKEIEKYKVNAAIMPREFTMDGLVKAIKQFYTDNY